VHRAEVGTEVGLDPFHLFVSVAVHTTALGEEQLAAFGIRGVVGRPVVELQLLGLGEQVLNHPGDLDRLQVVSLTVLLVGLIEELRHAGFGTEVARIADPLLGPSATGFGGIVP
jgi:hypothetical protein